MGSLAVLGALITLLGWSVIGSLYAISHGSFFGSLPFRPLAVGFLALPLVIWEQYSGALLMAVDHVEIYNRGQLIGRTVGVVLVILACYLEWGVVGVLVAMLISQGIVALFGARFLFRCAGSIMPDASTVRDLINGAIRLHPNYVGGFLITSSSILIVNHYLGAAETGQYQTALQLVGLLLVFPQGASMVMYGQVTQLGPAGAWIHQRHVIAVLMLVALCMARGAGREICTGHRLVADPAAWCGWDDVGDGHELAVDRAGHVGSLVVADDRTGSSQCHRESCPGSSIRNAWSCVGFGRYLYAGSDRSGLVDAQV